VNFLYPFFKFSALIYGARRVCESRGAPARNPYDLMEYVCDYGHSLLLLSDVNAWNSVSSVLYFFLRRSVDQVAAVDVEVLLLGMLLFGMNGVRTISLF
jgi:hypothetical protein